MKKWSTLVFLVNKSPEQPSECFDEEVSDLLTDSITGSGYSPSAGCINNIMDFARAYEVLESETAGQIELVIN